MISVWGILGKVNCGDLDITLTLYLGLKGSHSLQAQEPMVCRLATQPHAAKMYTLSQNKRNRKETKFCGISQFHDQLNVLYLVCIITLYIIDIFTIL